MLAVIIGLVLVIGYFVFLLVKPAPVEEPTSNVNTVENSAITNKANDNTNENTNTNLNTNEEPEEDEDAMEDELEEEDEDTVDASDDGEGLVQPAEDATSSDDAQTFTVYLPKSTADCGEVYAVEREQALSDDTYGDIIISAMSGPTSDDAGYVDGVPSGIYLRQVQYTADGPVITLSEGYDSLTDCQKATVDAQLIETANAMFELPEGTEGTVQVGEYTAAGESDTEEE